MTQAEIIRMAREAGYGDMDSWLDDETTPFLERFAALVAAHQKEAILKVLEECLDTGDDRGVETAVYWWNKAVKYCLNTVRASLD